MKKCLPGHNNSPDKTSYHSNTTLWPLLFEGKGTDTLHVSIINLSTARQKWRLDGLALSDHLLYSLVNHAYANRYHHHLVQ